MDQRYDAIILGAGAAGLMCAIEAGRRGRRVIVLERADRIGKKILISGGGRCNFTNLHTAPENFLSANPHFVKSALARYTPADFVRLVEKHRIPYHEKKFGQLFCDGSAASIVALLEEECRNAGVAIQTRVNVNHVSRGEEFSVRTESGIFCAPRIVVATGGLSIPKIGATSFGYDLARKFEVQIEPPRPALVPLVFSDDDVRKWSDLAGVSAEVVASVSDRSRAFRENMLITHRGLSGPAILQISSYWYGCEAISIDLAPGRELAADFRARGTRDAAGWKSLLREVLPRRMADRWIELHPLGSVSDRALAEAERQLHRWEVIPKETEGYAKAEVTAGGVDTRVLSSKTMQCQRVPGLFFIGEVVDVTGHLGGFNFQWAWASGFVAGQAL